MDIGFVITGSGSVAECVMLMAEDLYSGSRPGLIYIYIYVQIHRMNTHVQRRYQTKLLLSIRYQSYRVNAGSLYVVQNKATERL